MRYWLLFAVLGVTAWAAEFSTYIGDANSYRVARIVADAAGNTYLAGGRVLASGDTEVFVSKLDSSGKLVLFATLSGKGSDAANDLAVDAAGNIYVAGATSSPYLPVRNAFQAAPGPGFIAKFNPDATQIVFCTYFPEAVRALAVDGAGNVYVTGTTYSAGFPATAGLPNGPAVPFKVSGAFLTKLSADDSHVLYSTVIVGNNKDCGAGSSCFLSSRNASGVAVAVDPAGNAYLAGNTDTNDLPATAGAFLTRGTGAFVAKVNAAGTALAYLTLIGATNDVFAPFANPANIAAALAVDPAGNAYVAGRTFDPSFRATPGAFQTAYSGPTPQPPYYPLPQADAFVAKINPGGTGLVWATYLGGKQEDSIGSVALDASGNVWVAGKTASPDFPNAQGWSRGGDFLAGLNAAGSALVYAGRYPDGTVSQAVAVDGAGAVHAAGPLGLVSAVVPGRTPVPRVFGVANAAYGAAGGQIVSGAVVSLYGPHIGPAVAVSGAPDASGHMPTVLGGVQVFMNDVAVPLLYVSDSQINAVVPSTVYTPAVRIRVSAGSAEFPAATIPADPEVFQNTGGDAAAINQDGTVNSAAHPAPPGSVVSIWATGTPPALFVDGQVATAAADFGCCAVFAGPGPAEVLYGGAAPGIVAGVVQVNFRVPVPALDAVLPVTILSGDRSSASANIYVVVR